MKHSRFAKWRALMAVQADNPRLLSAQYKALCKQIPLMYFLLLVNSWALAYTHLLEAPRWLVLDIPLVLTLVSLVRVLIWRRSGKLPLTSGAILDLLTRTSRISGVIAVGYTAWALALFPYGDGYAQAHVAFYIAITVIGCAFCLMHLPSAALTTTGVVNLTFVVFFATTGNVVFLATAVNVMLVSLAMLVILRNHYLDFTHLVNAKAETEALNDDNQRLANQDSLTGLPNRRQFFAALDTELARARAQGRRLAVGILDLDGFKPVNDVYGHSIGDKLLVQVGQRLLNLGRDDIHMARLGGDEFALILTDAEDESAIVELGTRVCEVLRTPFMLTDVPIQIGASMGLATFPDRAANAKDVFEYADYALYQSKRHQPGTACVFSIQHHEQLHRDTLTEQALRKAEPDLEFTVFCQPIVDVTQGRTVAFEALARWISPELGHVSPAQFIPAAERIGLITRLTLPLLAKALSVANTWPAPIRLAFNLSAHDCGSAAAVMAIIETIRNSGFDPGRLDLEITETSIMLDIVQVQWAISQFRSLGCGISLDDFGTGYSSLSQLHALAPTKLKVDRSFVTGIQGNPASYKIVKSLLALSQDMGLDCVIEGVETPEELNALRTLGCRWVQGYLFSVPMPAGRTLAWLEQERQRD